MEAAGLLEPGILPYTPPKTWKSHSRKQEDALLSKAAITVCVTGIQWGKTTLGAMRMKIAMHTHTEETDNFLVVAPNYKIMQQSTLPAFMSLMRGYGKYNVADATFKMFGGGTCYFRTGTEPDSIVGMTNVRHVWGDEAGKFSYYFWENIQGRASFLEAPITLTTSPYSLNWILRELIRPAQAGQRDDCHLCLAASVENPLFPRKEYDRKKKTMDPRRFAAMYGGKFEKMEGLVYDCWDENENICTPFALPRGTRFVGMIDWGFTHEFVLLVRGVTPGKQHFQVSETARTGLTLPDQIKAAKSLKSIWGIEKFCAGPDQPGSIKEFNRHGLTCVPADNSVRNGIDCHYAMIQSRDYKVFEGTSPRTVDGYETYHYPEPKDLKTDQDDKEQNPVKQNDDAMDANRYGSMTFKSLGAKKAPQQPGRVRKMDDHQRLESHKRVRSKRYEDFG